MKPHQLLRRVHALAGLLPSGVAPTGPPMPDAPTFLAQLRKLGALRIEMGFEPDDPDFAQALAAAERWAAVCAEAGDAGAAQADGPQDGSALE